MREYIFHGKRVDCDEWVEGYLGHNKVRKQYYIMDDVNSFPIPVRKESVGQYTGMKDKNGRKIFEGDICKIVNRDKVVECIFEDTAFQFVKEYSDGSSFHWCGWGVEELEVIGNAFDNADLLEG